MSCATHVVCHLPEIPECAFLLSGWTQIFYYTMEYLHSECVNSVKQKDEIHWCRWFEFLYPPAVPTGQILLVDTMTVLSNLIGWYYDEM